MQLFGSIFQPLTKVIPDLWNSFRFETYLINYLFACFFLACHILQFSKPNFSFYLALLIFQFFCSLGVKRMRPTLQRQQYKITMGPQPIWKSKFCRTPFTKIRARIKTMADKSIPPMLGKKFRIRPSIGSVARCVKSPTI